MEHHEIENRLRSLGSEPLPEHLRELSGALVTPTPNAVSRGVTADRWSQQRPCWLSPSPAA